jgi:SAM-dependent methyltransferase
VNSARWDEIGRQWQTGELSPANGWQLWNEVAELDAERIRVLLPPGVQSIIEVGCGVGRLTPHLAARFKNVYCTDTSPVMMSITSGLLVKDGILNARVAVDTYTLPREIDAAVVWGNLYDQDWTGEQAASHADDMLQRAHLLLVQNPPEFLVGHLAARTVESGKITAPASNYLIAHAS